MPPGRSSRFSICSSTTASPASGFPTFSRSRSCSGIRRLRLPAAAVAVFVASMLANLLLGTGFELCALYSLANTISVVAGTTLIGKVCGDRKSIISGARDYAIMLLLGGIVARLGGGAVLGTAVAQSLDWPPIQTFWRWVAGEGLGFAVLFPVLMMVSRASLAGLSRREAAGAAGRDHRRQHAVCAGGGQLDAVPAAPGDRAADACCRLPGAARHGGRVRRGRCHADRIGGRRHAARPRSFERRLCLRLPARGRHRRRAAVARRADHRADACRPPPHRRKRAALPPRHGGFGDRRRGRRARRTHHRDRTRPSPPCSAMPRTRSRR